MNIDKISFFALNFTLMKLNCKLNFTASWLDIQLKKSWCDSKIVWKWLSIKATYNHAYS